MRPYNFVRASWWVIVFPALGTGAKIALRVNLDPAVSSAVFVATFTDVLGFLMYLGLATVFIHLLV